MIKKEGDKRTPNAQDIRVELFVASDMAKGQMRVIIRDGVDPYGTSSLDGSVSESVLGPLQGF